ncbi:MAG: DUF433 domain-containing protein [Chloroflexi bacterium]|nr:DUF433 domain-containing protein [Chloroflexota bacterium]
MTQDPAIMAGKPVVRGTRIPMEMVLEQLAFKPDLEELFAIYPELTLDDVRGCLAYAGIEIEGVQSQNRCAGSEQDGSS